MLLVWPTVSLSPPTIPHSEHPIAYKNQNPYIVKFQRPHRLISERQIVSGSIESNMSSPTPSLINTPRTFVSTNSGQDTLDIGSPLLSPGGTRTKKESDDPRYEFENKDGMYAMGLRVHCGEANMTMQTMKGSRGILSARLCSRIFQ